MNSVNRDSSSDAPVPRTGANLLAPLRAALSAVDEAERYRLLASVFAELAANPPSGENGRNAAAKNQLETLGKRLQSVEQEKASLADSLRTTQADLARRDKQLEAEQARAKELEAVLAEQRKRLKHLEQEQAEAQARIEERNAAIHKAEVRCEELTLKAQRAAMTAGDDARVAQIEQARVEVTRQLEQERVRLQTLRTEKDEQIAKLRQQLQAAGSAAPEDAGGATLAKLWERLARARPALAEGGAKPNEPAAERLVDAFIELVRFVDDFDKSMRVFLSRYTKYHPSVKVPWEAYTKGDDLVELARRTVAAQGGRPVGPLKMRLRLLYSWVYAAMVGCDSAFESVGSELQAHLMSEVGAANDPNRKVRDYIRDDGHLLFMQHLCELRSLKLAETYGRG